MIEDYLFNEDVYQSLKSSTKFKFIHIGLCLWKLVIESLAKSDPKSKAREQLADSLLGPNFLKVLVKNISNTKATLHDSVVSVKNVLV